MGTQPQKTQGLQNLFFHNRLCRAFFADHFGKKIFSIGQFFLHVIAKILSKSCYNPLQGSTNSSFTPKILIKILALSTTLSVECQYFGRRTTICRSNLKLFVTKMINEKSSTKHAGGKYFLRTSYFSDGIGTEGFNSIDKI